MRGGSNFRLLWGEIFNHLTKQQQGRQVSLTTYCEGKKRGFEFSAIMKGGFRMNIKHKVSISVADNSGNKQSVLKSRVRRLPQKLLTSLFGECVQVLILQPGQSVQAVEIHELPAMEERRA